MAPIAQSGLSWGQKCCFLALAAASRPAVRRSQHKKVVAFAAIDAIAVIAAIAAIAAIAGMVAIWAQILLAYWAGRFRRAGCISQDTYLLNV